MRTITDEGMRHAFEEVGHGLTKGWRWLKEKAGHLPSRDASSNRIEPSSEVAHADRDIRRRRSGLERLFWSGGPRIELDDQDRELLLRASLPGLDREDFSVEIEDRFLTLRAKHCSRTSERMGSYSIEASSYGSFARTIPLPCEVDADTAKAKFRQGVLTIHLPKCGAPKGRRIAIGG